MESPTESTPRENIYNDTSNINGDLIKRGSTELSGRKTISNSNNGTLKLNNGNHLSNQYTNEPSSSTERLKLPGAFHSLTLTKAMRIRFYRNGDQYYPGIVLTVSPDHYRSMDSLYERLNRVLADSTTLPHGVRYIFTIDGLKVIKSVTQLQNGHGYVCSSTENFKPLNYLSVQQPIWCSNASKPPPLTTSSLKTFIREPNDFVYPKIITIIRNGIKPRKIVRMLLNKKTALSFDQVMQEITALVKLNSGIVKKLVTLNRREVLRLADFFGDDNVFIAYGSNKVNEEDFDLADIETRKLFCTTKKTHRGRMHMPVRNESIIKRRESLSVNRDDLPELPEPLCGHIDLTSVLGDGNTAVVYKAYDREKQEAIALKVIPSENLYAMREFITIELNLMSRIDNEHIVKMYDYWNIDDSVYISLELMPEGDLFEYLKSSPFTELKAASLIRCLISALHYLHERNIIHRDVKPENLLVYTSNDLPCLKLADFGLAAIIENDNVLYELCGTPTYVAPEVLAELGYGCKVDIWSAGVILYVLLCGFPPFMSMEGNRDALFEMIMTGQFEFPHLVWDKKSYSVKALIQGMLNIDVEERHSAADILEYDWIKNLSKVDEEFENAAKIYYDLRIQRDADMNRDYNNIEGSSREIFYSRRVSMDELNSTQDDTSLCADSEASFTAVYPRSR